MARVLDRLTAPKAPIDTVRRHGAEEFHGSSMEESEKAEFWLEKLERVLEEVKFPPDQRALLRSYSYAEFYSQALELRLSSIVILWESTCHFLREWSKSIDQ